MLDRRLRRRNNIESMFRVNWAGLDQIYRSLILKRYLKHYLSRHLQSLYLSLEQENLRNEHKSCWIICFGSNCTHFTYWKLWIAAARHNSK